MLAHIKSGVLVGLEFQSVTIEVDVAQALPGFEVVGLPDTAVRESKDRIRAALKNAGYNWPMGRITVNLAPGDLRKEGPIYDLPMAIGILLASNQIQSENIDEFEIYGELGLGGSVRQVRGILPLLLNSLTKRVIIPYSNVCETTLAKGISVCGVRDLAETIKILTSNKHPENMSKSKTKNWPPDSLYSVDMADVKGQEMVKYGLEVAAAGNHNIMLLGSPGSGKTMLARATAGILPELKYEEALESTTIYSVSGLLSPDQPFISQRPFRNPHHNATITSIIGGGRYPQPGELSLSCHGVLFLDELPEFKREVLESLRQPLEEGVVHISRVGRSVTYPAKTMIIAAMNPCPCGRFFGDQDEQCSCTPLQIKRYLNRISGPFLDRMDIQIEVNRVDYKSLTTNRKEESSESIKQRVNKARDVQNQRLDGRTNSDMSNKEINKFCKLDKRSNELLEKAYNSLNLSGRGIVKLKSVARTIADLHNSENILFEHLAQAIQLRALENKYFKGNL